MEVKIVYQKSKPWLVLIKASDGKWIDLTKLLALETLAGERPIHSVRTGQDYSTDVTVVLEAHQDTIREYDGLFETIFGDLSISNGEPQPEAEPKPEYMTVQDITDTPADFVTNANEAAYPPPDPDDIPF
jgi:hypothetical protein